jgi:hypothetical protein
LVGIAVVAVGVAAVLRAPGRHRHPTSRSMRGCPTSSCPMPRRRWRATGR